MKKLMTTVAVCALASAVFAQVESVNIVGYATSVATGYKLGIPSFVAVGGGATVMEDLIDTSLLTPFVDEVQTYDPVAGTFTSLLWDGTGWSPDFGTTQVEVPVAPGKGYVMNFSADTVFAGEVVNGQSLTYTNTIAAGYSVVGSAFPTAMLTSNFNFASVLTAFVDEVQTYDSVAGSYTSWQWDGVSGFTSDFGTTYLPDQIAPAGEGVLFGNFGSATAIQVIETLL